MIVDIPRPYLLFLGDVQDELSAKTAFGIRDWCREDCVGQLRLLPRGVDLGLAGPDAGRGAWARRADDGHRRRQQRRLHRGELAAALARGCRSRARHRGRVCTSGSPTSRRSRPRRGARVSRCTMCASPEAHFRVGTGRKRAGKRLLTVGTDCAVGKKYTALAIDRELRRRGELSDFRATGQTGLLISGRGIVIDAVVADFIAGAAEELSPANRADHWDVVEGQGSLLHPSYAGVTLGLIHGTQPDALVRVPRSAAPGARRDAGISGSGRRRLRGAPRRGGAADESARALRRGERQYVEDVARCRRRMQAGHRLAHGRALRRSDPRRCRRHRRVLARLRRAAVRLTERASGACRPADRRVNGRGGGRHLVKPFGS